MELLLVLYGEYSIVIIIIKDKFLRLIDPRGEKFVSEVAAHEVILN